MARLIIDIANKNEKDLTKLVKNLTEHLGSEVATVHIVDISNENQFHNSEEVENGSTNFFTLKQLAHYESICDDESDTSSINYERTFDKFTQMVYDQVYKEVNKYGDHDGFLIGVDKKINFSGSTHYSHLIIKDGELLALRGASTSPISDVSISELIEFLDIMTLSVEYAKLPISVGDLSRLLLKLKPSHGTIGISQNIDSDGWGIKRKVDFENEYLLFGYYGGFNVIYNFQTDENEDPTQLKDFLHRNVTSSSDAFINKADFYKLLKAKD